MSSSKSDEIVIGILGIVLFASTPYGAVSLGLGLAMQGAFAEHQVALQKVRVDRPIKIMLIRQVEDLVKCDGLIIPGGGIPLYCNPIGTVLLML